MRVDAKKQIRKACYALDVVALKLVYDVLCCANVFGIVKTTALCRNSFCHTIISYHFAYTHASFSEYRLYCVYLIQDAGYRYFRV